MNSPNRTVARLARALRGRKTVSILIAFAALVWGIATMSRYGVTFDAPALFYAGDRTLLYLTHPAVPHALDLLERSDPPGFHFDFPPHPQWSDIVHYPVLPGLVCALTNEVFHVWLRWVDKIDGHQLGLVFLHAFALGWYCWYVARLFGLRAAVLATLLVATFPSALGHSYNNPKDWPCAQFYGLTVLAAAAGITERRGRDLVVAGIWLGVSLSCKLNGVFALATVVLWAPVAYALLYWRRRRLTPGVVGGFLAIPYIGGALFFYAWPWLHHGDIREWLDNLYGYVSFMCRYGVSDPHPISIIPLRVVLYTTPPVVLAGALLAVLALPVPFQRSRLDAARWTLLLLWAGLPVARECTPRAFFYDVNRHYIEYIPGLCALAGVGLSRTVDWAAALADRWRLPRRWRSALSFSAVAVLAGLLVRPIVQYHPFETTYFNALAGGLGRAQRLGLLLTPPPLDGGTNEECDFWFQSMREALVRLRPLLHPSDTIAALGPWPDQVRSNWEGKQPAPLGPTSTERTFDLPKSTFVVAIPRHWRDFHELERTRPVILRTLRDGGVIYEVFGPPDGKVHPLLSPLTPYDEMK